MGPMANIRPLIKYSLIDPILDFRASVSLDLGPNCLQRLSVDDKSRR